MASHASLRILALSALGLCTASAQVPDVPAPAGAPAPAPAAGGGAAKPKAVGSPFGQEIPVLDPGSEVMTFNGKNWNISNNRIFQARFEKFLNAPEATTGDEAAYRQIIDRILVLLQPGNATVQNIDAAFRLLPYAGRYDIDANHCDTLGASVLSLAGAAERLSSRECQRLARGGLAETRMEHRRGEHGGHVFQSARSRPEEMVATRRTAAAQA